MNASNIKMTKTSATLLLCRVAATLLVLVALWAALAESTSINIYKHRYPFYGGYGYGGPFYGGYGGGGFGGGFRGGISIGGGGWGR